MQLSRTLWTSAFVVTTTGVVAAAAYFLNPYQTELEVTPHQFAPTILIKKDYLHSNLARFQFRLPNDVQPYFDSVPMPLYYTFANDELNVTRDYTPIVYDPIHRTMDFLIQRIPQGETSNYLHRLNINDVLRMKGPFSQWSIPPEYQRIGMIAGDSGITVFLQVLPKLLNQGKTVHLLFYSTSGVHLLKEDLETWKQTYPSHFFTTYLTEEPTASHVQTYLPTPKEQPLILLCCPKPLMGVMAGYKDESSLLAQGEFSGLLKELKFNEEDVHKF